MKKIITTLFIAAVVAVSAMAQPRNNIKLNLFSVFVRTVNVSYEMALKDNLSAQLGGHYFIGYDVDNSGSGITNKTSMNGWGIVPEIRLYPSGNAMDGFYIAPFLRYRTYKLTQDYNDGISNYTAEANWNQIGGGLVIGRQWIFGDVISMDMFIGPGFTSNSYKYKGTADQDDFDTGQLGDGNVFLRCGFKVGYAF